MTFRKYEYRKVFNKTSPNTKRLAMLGYVRIDANNLVKKGYSRSEAFKKAWKHNKRVGFKD